MMPQLRDSGNHPIAGGPSDGWHGERPSDMTAPGTPDRFDRIFGIETEYGVSVTGTDASCDAGHVAMEMFRPVISAARSTNTYLDNGSRLYLDVGSHPEYATAEARDPMDALKQDRAGETVMRDMALLAQERLRERYGTGTTVHVYKNNVDSAGHSFGCHENYLVRRYVPLEMIERQLLPFLITRQIFTGAGRMTEDGFRITQRADFLDEAVSSATTRARPMVNTRDEPHADPDAYRRLHVIIGDSNRSQFATWMKLATTHLVLCVMESALRHGKPTGFEECELVDPAAANHAVSRDISCRNARLDIRQSERFREFAARAHGSDGADYGTSALAIQYRYCAVVSRFVDRYADVIDRSMSVTRARDVVAQWRSLLDDIADGRFERLADRVDWIAKYRLLTALRARHPGIDPIRLEQVDMDYHDIANGNTYRAMLAHNAVRSIIDDEAASQAVHEPPSDTRAALRGRFVKAARQVGARYSCDWTRLTLTTPVRRDVVLLDPFDGAGSEEYREMMESLRR